MLPAVNMTSTAYWQVTLLNGKKISGVERAKVTPRDLLLNPLLKGLAERSVDWTLDLVTTGDVLRIAELAVIAPGFNRVGVLKITEPGTAFQFKNASAISDSFGQMERVINALVVGRVDDKETGACTCWIWDRELGLLPYQSNVKDFGSWSPKIAPIHGLAHDVIGLRL